MQGAARYIVVGRWTCDWRSRVQSQPLHCRVHTAINRVAQKRKPLPNDQKIVLNRIKACQVRFDLFLKLKFYA